MRDDEVFTGALLDESALSLDELARVCGVSDDWLERHVEDGLLGARAGAREAWRFSSRDLWRVRQLCLLERDFDAVPELAALVADLMEELDALRRRLRRAGLG